MNLSRNNLPHDIKSYLTANKVLSTTTDPVFVATKLLTNCYDDYYCVTPESAMSGHILIGIFGFIITLIGIVMNVLVLPVLSLIGIRSSATSYMVAMAVTDICYLIVNLILSVILYIPSSSMNAQQLMYQNFIAYFVPLGYPLRLIFQLLSFVLCLAFMIDRYYYMKQENKNDEEHHTKRSSSFKFIAAIVIITILVKLPNFLLLRIVEKKPENNISILFNPFASMWMFILDLVMIWLLYIIYVIVLVLLVNQLWKKRALPLIIKQKLYQVTLTQRYKRRERICFNIAVIIGSFTLLFKLPLLASNCIIMSDLIKWQKKIQVNLVICEQIDQLMEIVLIMLKPVIYLVLGVHFRKALSDMIGLWIRPSRYQELHVSGGMGKRIWLNYGDEDPQIKRNDTVNSFIRSSTDKLPETNKSVVKVALSPTSSSRDIDMLAKSYMKKRSSSNSHKSNSIHHVASISSVETSSGIDSQYATPIL